MSTPSISAPTRMPSDLDRLARRARGFELRRLVRGREADPAWARPLLWLVALLAGALTFWGLTRSGYANTYYAEAAQAASHSWKAWLTNAIDTSGSDSLDKGPLSNMLMGLSGRLFGFSSFSMLAPEALCGVGAVLVLHNTVKRTLGHRAAILAALMLALTPIFVAMSRFNNPDALLVLLEVAAAWALVRALQSGRTRDVLLCGVFVGLAFNVKMLQAYLIVPGLAATLLIAGQGSLRRRARAAAGRRRGDVRRELRLVRDDDADPRGRPALGGRHDRQLVVLADLRGQRTQPRVRRRQRPGRRRRPTSAAPRAFAAVQLDRRRSDRLAVAARGWSGWRSACGATAVPRAPTCVARPTCCGAAGPSSPGRCSASPRASSTLTTRRRSRPP